MTTTQITPEFTDPRPRVDRPCPSWCGREPGHPWEGEGDTGVYRWHSRRFSPQGQALVSVAAEEHAPQNACDCPSLTEQIADLTREANALIGVSDEERRAEFTRRKDRLMVGWTGCDCDLTAAGPSTTLMPVVQLDVGGDDLEPIDATQLATWLRQAAIACARYREGSSHLGQG